MLYAVLLVLADKPTTAHVAGVVSKRLITSESRHVLMAPILADPADVCDELDPRHVSEPMKDEIMRMPRAAQPSGERSGSMDQPTAEQALRQLQPLVGEWIFEAKWPDGKRWPGGGRVTFEWLASGAHLLQRGTAELPEAPDNTSVIGCDAANG